MLELKDISKQFQGRKVLNDISICFPDTGLIGIQGESGCGKSTLLYILGMLDNDYEGAILYDKQEITDSQSFILQHVSYMMQNKDVIDSLTIKENIILACLVSGKRYTSTQFKKVTSQLGIVHLLSKYPSQLSGGQLKRVSIAKALLKKADIILCDEPTGALHYQQAQEVMKLLQQVSQSALVIIVSHDIELLKTYCDHLLTLSDGQLSSFQCSQSKQHVSILPQQHFSFLWFYPIRQICYQKYKLLILFVFQWLVIISFFLIVTGMNGVFDAIEQSEQFSVMSHVMTIENKNGQSFTELISHPFITYISYECDLERLQVTSQTDVIKCQIAFLPRDTSHIVLESGRLPTTADEIIVSHKLYQTLHHQSRLNVQNSDNYYDMKIVGVIENSFFSENEVYCHRDFKEALSSLESQHMLRIESLPLHTYSLYHDLAKHYFVYSDVIERVENYQSLLSLVRMIAGVFIVISFLISLLLIGIVESTIYLERQHDTAYLLSLGMSKKRLFMLSLSEALLIGGMIAAGGGLLSGIVYYYVNEVFEIQKDLFFKLSLHPIFYSRWDLFMIIFISYMVMSILGIIIPMTRMMKTDKISVLREE